MTLPVQLTVHKKVDWARGKSGRESERKERRARRGVKVGREGEVGGKDFRFLRPIRKRRGWPIWAVRGASARDTPHRGWPKFGGRNIFLSNKTRSEKNRARPPRERGLIASRRREKHQRKGLTQASGPLEERAQMVLLGEASEEEEMPLNVWTTLVDEKEKGESKGQSIKSNDDDEIREEKRRRKKRREKREKEKGDSVVGMEVCDDYLQKPHGLGRRPIVNLKEKVSYNSRIGGSKKEKEKEKIHSNRQKRKLLLYMIVLSSFGLQSMATIAASERQTTILSTRKTTNQLPSSKVHHQIDSSSNGEEALGSHRDDRLTFTEAEGLDLLDRNQRRLVVERRASEQAPECRSLSNLWQFLHHNYPTLSLHLLKWAEQQVDGLPAANRLPQQYQLGLGRLLEEADKQLVEQQQPAQHQELASETNSLRPPQQPSWMAKVSSNPSYARLVALLRSKQQQQQQQQQQKEKLTQNGGGHSKEPNKAPSEQDDQQQLVSYGRVVHYPHELLANGAHWQTRRLGRPLNGETSALLEGSGAAHLELAADPLDKLRLLGQQTRLRQQQLARANESGQTVQQNHISSRPTGADPNAALGSLSAEIEQMSASDWRKLSESATDAARNRYVYGRVLYQPLGPSTRSPSQPRPLDNVGRDPASVSGGKSAAEPEGQAQSFGRLVPIPPLGWPAAFREQIGDEQAPKDRPHSIQQQQQHHNQPHQSEHSQSIALSAGGNAANPVEEPSDELVPQAKVHHFSIGDQNGNGPSGSGPDEEASTNPRPAEDESEAFEGHFHNGPLEEIEVRQLRSGQDQMNNNSNDDAEANEAARRTHSSKRTQADRRGAFNERNVFVVD